MAKEPSRVMSDFQGSVNSITLTVREHTQTQRVASMTSSLPIKENEAQYT